MNIEKTISEHAVSDILTPMLESQDRIVTEDVAPLFDQATGLDTPPASGSVTTTIEESRSVITAIIRKAWTATLTMLGGASVLSSIAAAYTYLRNRLQGNETYGIPDRRSEISASSPLAANLALLNDRKIGGVPEAADGMSMARVLCDKNLEVTELMDDNYGYEFTNAKISACLAANPKVKKFTCNGTGELADGAFNGNNVIESIHMPNATRLHRYSGRLGAIMNCGNLKEILLEGCTNAVGDDSDYPCIYNCAKLQKVVFGKVTGFISVFRGTMPDIIHVEFAQGVNVSINFESNYGATWNPTNALDASRTDLIEEGSTAQNNLQQFLENFRDYIADKLQGGYPIGQGPILTLSQAVRNAIHAAESTYGIENIIITKKGWTISPAPN